MAAAVNGPCRADWVLRPIVVHAPRYFNGVSALFELMAAPEPPNAAPLPQLPADHPAQVYAALPTRELVNLVQRASGDRTAIASQAVFQAFYYKYFNYLAAVVSNSLGFLHDRDGIQEIVHDALVAFFQASSKFDLGFAPDDVGCDRLVRSYLGRLAKWKANHARSFQKSFGAHVLDLEELDACMNESIHAGAPVSALRDEQRADDPRIERVRRWFETLRDVEQDILRTYFLDDHSGQKSSRLPGGVARRLAEKHRVTTSNIRHLKLKLRRQLHDNFLSA